MTQFSKQEWAISLGLAVIAVSAIVFAFARPDHDGLAGSVVGAAGTIFAGYIAWRGVQRQIGEQAEALKEQRRATDLAERIFLNGERARLENELAGLEIAHEIIGPPAEAVRQLRETGVTTGLVTFFQRWKEAIFAAGGMPKPNDERVQFVRDFAPRQIVVDLLHVLSWRCELDRRSFESGGHPEGPRIAERLIEVTLSLDKKISEATEHRKALLQQIEARP